MSDPLPHPLDGPFGLQYRHTIPGRLAAWIFRYEDRGERIKR